MESRIRFAPSRSKRGVGRALEQAETLEREAKLFHERLQSLADRAKGLEAFAQEHALRCAYEERQLKELQVAANPTKELVSSGRL